MNRTRAVHLPGARGAAKPPSAASRREGASLAVAPASPLASRSKQPRERAEQAALFTWLNTVAPPGLFYTAIPGGDRQQTRTPGYTRGTPDVLLIWRGRAILIEMKRRKGGRVEPQQQAVHRAITLAGGAVFVARGWADAAGFIRAAIPMKGAA